MNRQSIYLMNISSFRILLYFSRNVLVVGNGFSGEDRKGCDEARRVRGLTRKAERKVSVAVSPTKVWQGYHDH